MDIGLQLPNEEGDLHLSMLALMVRGRAELTGAGRSIGVLGALLGVVKLGIAEATLGSEW